MTSFNDKKKILLLITRHKCQLRLWCLQNPNSCSTSRHSDPREEPLAPSHHGSCPMLYVTNRSTISKAPSHQRADQPPLSPALEKVTDRQWAGLNRGDRVLVWNTAGIGRARSDRSSWSGNVRGLPHSPLVVGLAGIQRDGRRYSVSWSYFDREWSAIERNATFTPDSRPTPDQCWPIFMAWSGMIG